MAEYEDFIPVNLLTGFLGSGKTTLLQRLLESPRLANTAVLINEFGEVGLDHLILETVDEATVVLQSGCVCCTIRSDLKEAIAGLYDKSHRGLIPKFDRIVIETTGLADPAPIVFTLRGDPMIRHHFRLGNIVTTVDALNAERQLVTHNETAKQIAVADRIVLTKTDLVEPEIAERLVRIVKAINGTAKLYDGRTDPVDADDLMSRDIYDPETKSDEVRGWLEEEAARPDHVHGVDRSRHAGDIHTFCLTEERPLDWTAFGIWLSMLVHAHGEKMLRVKGLINVAGLATPVVINGVQHVIHPPAHLDHWPSDDMRSRVIFVVQGLDPDLLQRSLAAFNRLAVAGADPA
ncbi:MAG: GTP-binding protein [Alphaproteobacteria bacterium]|nr:GTP-binding protein [Alphaproteobacteria bacterium]